MSLKWKFDCEEENEKLTSFCGGSGQPEGVLTVRLFGKSIVRMGVIRSSTTSLITPLTQSKRRSLRFLHVEERVMYDRDRFFVLESNLIDYDRLGPKISSQALGKLTDPWLYLEPNRIVIIGCSKR